MADRSSTDMIEFKTFKRKTQYVMNILYLSEDISVMHEHPGFILFSIKLVHNNQALKKVLKKTKNKNNRVIINLKYSNKNLLFMKTFWENKLL